MTEVDLVPLKEHYERLLAEHADSAQACSWGSEEVALRNFAAVAQVFAHETQSFSVYEVGCGLGMFQDFLERNFPLAAYSGCDIVEGMVERARARRPDLGVEVRDILTAPPRRSYDYVVVSGLFNLRMHEEPEAWLGFVKSMLRAMYGFAGSGIAANFLTSYVEWKRVLGYYQNPGEIFDFVQTELSRFSEIRHSYYPWEFVLFSYRNPKPLPYGPPVTVWPPTSRERPDDRQY